MTVNNPVPVPSHLEGPSPEEGGACEGQILSPLPGSLAALAMIPPTPRPSLCAQPGYVWFLGRGRLGWEQVPASPDTSDTTFQKPLMAVAPASVPFQD